jgi:hypothetical protein
MPNITEQNPSSEADSRLTCQEIPLKLRVNFVLTGVHHQTVRRAKGSKSISSHPAALLLLIIYLPNQHVSSGSWLVNYIISYNGVWLDMFHHVLRNWSVRNLQTNKEHQQLHLLLGCYTVPLGQWFPTFRRIVVPSSSGPDNPGHSATTQKPWSFTPLWELQIWHRLAITVFLLTSKRFPLTILHIFLAIWEDKNRQGRAAIMSGNHVLP